MEPPGSILVERKRRARSRSKWQAARSRVRPKFEPVREHFERTVRIEPGKNPVLFFGDADEDLLKFVEAEQEDRDFLFALQRA
jgi:hypothetical protein